jgi:hypothetical protein
MISLSVFTECGCCVSPRASVSVVNSAILTSFRPLVTTFQTFTRGHSCQYVHDVLPSVAAITADSRHRACACSRWYPLAVAHA